MIALINLIRFNFLVLGGHVMIIDRQNFVRVTPLPLKSNCSEAKEKKVNDRANRSLHCILSSSGRQLPLLPFAPLAQDAPLDILPFRAERDSCRHLQDNSAPSCPEGQGPFSLNDSLNG